MGESTGTPGHDGDGAGSGLDTALARTRARAAELRTERRRRIAAGATALALLVPIALVGGGVLGDRSSEPTVTAADTTEAATTDPSTTDPSTTGAMMPEVSVMAETAERPDTATTPVDCPFVEQAEDCAASARVPEDWAADRQRGRLMFRYWAPDEGPLPTDEVGLGGGVEPSDDGTRTATIFTPVVAATELRFAAVVTLPCAPSAVWSAATLAITTVPGAAPTAEFTVIHRPVESVCAPGAVPFGLIVPLDRPFGA